MSIDTTSIVFIIYLSFMTGFIIGFELARYKFEERKK